MGYHYGDIDLQLSHSAQNVKALRGFKAAGKFYKKEFGDRGSFTEGYQSGFRVGYADAIDGSEFRAVLNMRELAQELPEVDQSGLPVLNQAITRGYTDGVKTGLNDGRASALCASKSRRQSSSAACTRWGTGSAIRTDFTTSTLKRSIATSPANNKPPYLKNK